MRYVLYAICYVLKLCIKNGLFADNMLMIKSIGNFASVKSAVEKLQGKPVSVVQNLGRNKFTSYDGVVTGVYQALFTVLPSNAYNGKTSFSYSEIMCGSVKLKERA